MILTLFESVQKAYTRKEQIIDADWNTIANFLLTHNEAEKKEDVPLFNLWEFDINGELGRRRIYEKGEPTEAFEEIQGTIRRCRRNAVYVAGLVLDIDEHYTISGAKELFKDFEFVLYSTFRNTPIQNKFRVVLPFSSRCSKEVIAIKKKSISETFKEVDHASFSESQSFYLHSGANPYTHWNKGMFLDPDWFEDEIIEKTQLSEIKRDFTGDRNIYKEKLIDSLATCSGLHYNGATRYNVLTLVSLCKSADITYDEFDILCRNMIADDSSLQNPNLRKAAWIGWKPHSGITTKVREQFITDHNGKSAFTKQESKPVVQRTAQEIREYIKEKYMNRESNNG